MNNPNNIIITKASGEKEPFDISKLERSLKNAGTSTESISHILKHIKGWIYPGVRTKLIYREAFSLLRKDKALQSVKYKLKQAFLELGSSGYPFEKLIGELFRRQGYTCEVGVVVQGGCITHEMDVIATKDHAQHLMECKYRHDQGNQISIQVPLYVQSRVKDIVNQRKFLPEYKDYTFKGWVVTNTRFSQDSMDYSKCSGLNLLGWDYPKGRGLKDLVEEYSLYPISILVGLTNKEKQALLNDGIVTCCQLFESKDELNRFNFGKAKLNRVFRELEELVGSIQF